jgi:hypothetical protein
MVIACLSCLAIGVVLGMALALILMTEAVEEDGY